MDLNPRYAGTLFGMTNTVANFAGFIAPYITGTITKTDPTLQAWKIVFLINSAIYLVSNVIYITLMSTEIQNFSPSTS